MFPNDIWVADPNVGQLYRVENDKVAYATVAPLKTSAILVSQDMIHVYTAHLEANKVTRYRGGVRVLDIPVGRMPYGMCEDGNGNIWVTNYGDNTVSKIVDGVVTKTIPVHRGPRGIVADSRNKVYVCSYLGNVIDIITNDVLVESITVKTAPRAITCDLYDNIWVANYGSNTVAKIKNSQLVMNFNLANISKGPCAIVSDSKGIVYVANFLGNDITVIEGTRVSKNIAVGAAPTAIAVTADDTVYVTSEIEGTIVKIANGARITDIDVCTNPTAFGDFTGAATHNIYHAPSTPGLIVPTGGWTMSQMSNEVQQLLGKIKTNAVDTASNLVSYSTSRDCPTVKDALDKIYKASPIINKFEVSNDTFEHGETVSSIQIHWNFNKPMSQATLKIGSTLIADLRRSLGDVIPSAGTSIITGLTITKPTVLLLEITDEQGITTNASVQIKFKHRLLYGTVNDDLVFVSQETLEKLSKSQVSDGPYGKYFRFDCGNAGNKIPIIAVPSSWGIDASRIAFINGYATEWRKVVVSYTNAVGGTADYDVFVFSTSLAGEYLATIVDVL